MTLGARPLRKPIVPSGVFVMLVFVVAEAMMFAGLCSAYLVTKATTPGGVWPPPGQPRLPIEATAVNTVALLVSGVLFFLAAHRFKTATALARAPYAAAMALGTFFLLAQGYEWMRLLNEGMTLTSSVQGRFFYLLVGAHGVHVLGAVGMLLWGWTKLRANELAWSELATMRVFWTFVVGLWPILYVLVYL